MFQLQILLACVMLTSLLSNTKSEFSETYICQTATEYASGSIFESNLKLLLSSLIENTSKTRFLNDTIGDIPNRIYGSSLCRGDINATDCTSCVTKASQNLPQLCPYNRGGTVWYEECRVRYSNRHFFSHVNVNGYNICTPQKWSDPHLLEQAVIEMMHLISKNSVQSSQMFSTGVVNLTASEKIYGLVQCARDLTGDQCLQCLNTSVEILEEYCYGNMHGIFLAGSCILWYETDKFFFVEPFLNVPAPAWVKNPPDMISAPAEAPEEPTKGKGKKTVSVALGVGLPLVLSALAILLFACIQRRKRIRNRISKLPVLENIKGGKSLLFEFSTLQEATENFSDLKKLGEGGFGPVYKGKLPDGQEIAVKRLSKGSNQGLSQLENEVQFLAELQHKNLVRLLGVCMEKKEMLLVYEYICNKSLDTFIFDNTNRIKLYWDVRLRIIQGISRGLLYLHQDSAIRTVHRDLKASNILLDENLNPKISDFGLARLLGGEVSQSKTSKVVGTFGYMAPEYAVQGTVSTKVDIFSFGVLILEIITGRSNKSFAGTSAGNLLSYAWECWTNGTAVELIDPCLGHERPLSNHEVVQCINIGLLCVQKIPEERPNIFSVNLMLTRKQMQVPPPSTPAFVFGASGFENREIETSYNSMRRSSVKNTINEVSYTEPYPR